MGHFEMESCEGVDREGSMTWETIGGGY